VGAAAAGRDGGSSDTRTDSSTCAGAAFGTEHRDPASPATPAAVGTATRVPFAAPLWTYLCVPKRDSLLQLLRQLRSLAEAVLQHGNSGSSIVARCRVQVHEGREAAWGRQE